MVVSSWRESFPSVGKRAQPLSYVTSVIGDRLALSTGILISVHVLSAGRKVGMTSNQHGPLMPWATLMLQWD